MLSFMRCTRHGHCTKADLIYVILALAAITGALLAAYIDPHWRWMHYFTKPTATAFLLYLVLSTSNPVSVPYRNAIAWGLAFAIGGDIFLMLPQDYFLAGLICFLLTHCAYIYALTRDSRLAEKPLVFAGFAIVAFLIIIGLWQSLPAGMHIPVTIYAVILAVMAAQALSRALHLSSKSTTQSPLKPANVAALGGIFFVISDSILAYGRFRFNIPFNSLWVLGTYYTAQWCFARSVIRRVP